MAVCYKKLWKMLIDKDMIKKDLRLQTGFSTTTMSKLSKETSWNLFLIKKRNRKEAKHYGSFLSVYSVFDQRTVPFL